MTSVLFTLLFCIHHGSFGKGVHTFPGQPLTIEDFQNGDKLAPENDPATSDPIHLANLYEGDIVMETGTEKNAIKDAKLKWAHGTIPYTISSDFATHERSVIARAMSEFHSRTCIRFQPRSTKDHDFVSIEKGNQGCSSHVGRLGKGGQALTLGYGCVSVGIALHEMMHAVGFWHEQSRPDRDEFVNVLYDNIKDGMAYNFNKQTWNVVQNLSTKYDTGSIMHYGAYAFSKKGLPTILPKDPNAVIGQRKEFSMNDVTKINALYKCPQANQATPISCLNESEHCEYWRSIGECSRNPKYMNTNCKKSCSNCSGCQDSNEHCIYWSTNGECSKNPKYMNTNCRKSCGFC